MADAKKINEIWESGINRYPAVYLEIRFEFLCLKKNRIMQLTGNDKIIGVM